MRCRVSWPVLFLISLAMIRTSIGDEREQFFESRVRPLLVERCSACHGPEKQQGGVRLDQRAGVFGRSPADALVVAGHPEQSRLLQVVRYSPDDVQMPPKGKLPQAEIDVLTEWVRQGAYWPAEQSTGQTSDGLPRTADGSFDFQASSEQHWSYRPLKHCPEVPVVEGLSSNHPIDRFRGQARRDAGVSPQPAADRRTLIRRATFDLLGIPPTYEEVETFVRDDQPDAWPRLVDRLLASPLYGQRWARHWLDVARYADTKGYVFQENHRYPFSYTYRDYVIDAFNADKPFDRFIVEQLAADKLGLPEGDPALAAMGFISVGPRLLNREPDVIDDRIDLVTRGLMGMTVGCARCHDHKYDPVPTEDYYSLYGVFQSSTEPENLPVIGKPDPAAPGFAAFTAELNKRQQAVDEYRLKTTNELLGLMRSRAGDCLLAALKKRNAAGAAATAYRQGEPRERLAEAWLAWLGREKRDRGAVFGLLFDVAERPVEQFSGRLEELLAEPPAGKPLGTAPNSRLLSRVKEKRPQTLADLLVCYEDVFAQVDQEWQAAVAAGGDAPPQSLPDPASEELRRVVIGPGSVTDIPGGAEARLFERDHRDQLRKLERKVEEWQVESPDAPARAMVLNDKPEPVEPVVFIRGDVNRRGERVPRQAPRILTKGESRPFTAGSGRLELAQIIASSENPLTARVIVNRVWGWHFGRGIVPTASDFGMRGEKPSHPELLDWLAWTFMHEDGWSLKKLHRRILLSDLYQQSSASNEAAASKDPENELYWRFPRRRLEFEPMRDALLSVAGKLDTSLGGRPVDMEAVPYSGRRSVYGRIDRNNFSSLLRTFDYPSPDSSSPGRPVTTVPQQALYALNSPFVRSMAEAVAAHVAAIPASTGDRSPQIVALYRRVLSRNPSAQELTLAEDYLRRNPDDLVLLAQSLLMTNEFVFVD